MSVNPATHSPELFQHVRILVGVILGLSVGKLLQGLAQFVEHPNATGSRRRTWRA